VGGGSLGYQGIPNSIALEFDTWKYGTSRLDPNGNHISVHTKGADPNSAKEDASVAAANDLPTTLGDGATHTVRVTYSPLGAGKLQVILDGGETPVIDHEIKLTDTFPSEGPLPFWAGFTASTGGAWENHDILSWAICTPEVPVLTAVAALLDVGGPQQTNTIVPTAYLTRPDGTGIEAATIEFTTKSDPPVVLCTAETSSDGLASCTPEDNNLRLQIVTGRGYIANYAGTNTCPAATASAPIIRNAGTDVL
jgi:hypothetical protein